MLEWCLTSTEMQRARTASVLRMDASSLACKVSIVATRDGWRRGVLVAITGESRVDVDRVMVDGSMNRRWMFVLACAHTPINLHMGGPARAGHGPRNLLSPTPACTLVATACMCR